MPSSGRSSLNATGASAVAMAGTVIAKDERRSLDAAPTLSPLTAKPYFSEVVASIIADLVRSMRRQASTIGPN